MFDTGSAKRLLKKILLRARLPQTLSRLSTSRAVILRYHSIQEAPHAYALTIGQGITHAASVFDAQMAYVARHCRPITLDELLRAAQEGCRLPFRSVAITFDDGFRDNYEIAAPILDRHGLRAAFFVTVNSTNDGDAPWFCRLRYAFNTTPARRWIDPATDREFNLADTRQRHRAFLDACRCCAGLTGGDQRRFVDEAEAALEAGPFPSSSVLMMNWSEAGKLREVGHIVGSHTLTHPNLPNVSIEVARYELEESKRVIERELGGPVDHFSYPSPIGGRHWTDQTVSITRQLGYQTAVTCNPGAVARSFNPLCLSRIAVPGTLEEFRWALETTLGMG